MPTASGPMWRVSFAGAVGRPGQPIPGRLPQVAFAGRSNVGKSSLINALVGRKRLARVSKTPGRTREINFFDVDGRFLIVDLPGYGFARVPRHVRRAWGPLVESYLGTSPQLLGVALLVDARRGPQPDDRQMLDYLGSLQIPILLVLTKIDALRRSARGEAVLEVGRALGLEADQIIATSARARTGMASLGESVEALIAEGGERE